MNDPLFKTVAEELEEITPEMIGAGVSALNRYQEDASLFGDAIYSAERVVAEVYSAMAALKPHPHIERAQTGQVGPTPETT